MTGNHTFKIPRYSLSRRDFLRAASIGSAGAAFGTSGMLITRQAHAGVPLTEPAQVSFAHGKNCYDIITQTLQPLKDEIREKIKGKQVVVKPNCVVDYEPLCASEPDAIRAVLDFLKPVYDQPVIFGESTASPNGTMYCFEQYGYMTLEREYDVKIMSLDTTSYTDQYIVGADGQPQSIRIIDTFLDPDNFVISLTRMKTHGGTVATLSLKNTVMAAPINFLKGHPEFKMNKEEKGKMHQGGPRGLHYNIFTLAHKVRPHLAIVDGFVGMEGNGPARGTPVEHGVALAGFDTIAVDRVGLELMEIPLDEVGYLMWCAEAGLGQGDRDLIDVIGPDPKKYSVKYRMADNFEQQMKWKDD